MAGYTRQSTYTDGDVIQASDSNTEFDQVLAAFNNSTGHAHDGTTAEGPVIGLIGDAGVTTPLNKIAVDTGNDRLSFYVDVSAAAVEQLRVEDGVAYPVTNNDIDLGTSVFMFKDGYFAGLLESVSLQVTNIKANDGTAAGSIADSTGIFTIASAVLTTADINGGTIDGTTIGATTPAAITGTTVTGTSFVSSGNMSFGDNDKAVFGAGSDLQIYSDGTDSFIEEGGTGSLYVDAANLLFRTDTGEDLAKFLQNGQVQLFNNNEQKLATTSTGVDVTGTITTGDIISSEEGISTPTADGITIERPTGSVSPTPVELRMSTTTAAGDWSTTDPWGRVAFYSKDTSSGGGKVHASMEVRAAHISGGRSKLALKTSSSSADDLQDALVLDPDTGSGRHVTVSDGNLVIGTSGNGIDFSATSGSGTSELFDDYEEGLHTTTITPTTSGTISLTSSANTLFYTKIGNVVHVSGYVYVSAVSSPVGALSVSLPFPAVDIPNTGGSSAASLWLTNTNSGANVADFVGVVDEGNSYLLIQLGDGSSTQSDSAQQIKVASQIKLSLTYRVA
jgi:hypothetical protein